ncbi:MAG: hypothetical protein IT319_07840 [Anaerolineae bacterium]|nr:hypothetical protein [Anaerolineae bacterium]
MDARKLKITLLLAVLLSVALPAQAQETLPLATPVTGSVTAGATNAWTFFAQNGAVLSFALEAQTDGFDPAMTLTDSSGREIVSSDDYNYPDSLDPLLEAITMPRTDTFTLTVRGINDTSGDYTLTMLPGYSVSAYSDDFSANGWRALNGVITAQQADGQLQLSTEGVRPTSAAFSDGSTPVQDFYAQAQVVNVTDPSGWAVGMAVRRSGQSYYLLAINSVGNWRFTLVQNGSETVIRDWTPHPNIIPGASSFSIGVLARGVGFDFFYNTGYIGSASDRTLTDAGQIGLTVGAFSAQPSRSSATFDDLIVTQPAEIDGHYVIPQEITTGDARQMVLALKRNHVVVGDGELALTLPDSSVQSARAGVERVMLGRGVRYTNFALGTTVNLSPATSGPAGCGLVFRLANDTDYTIAYFDQDGDYGVSKRSGDTFSDDLYGQNSAIGGGTHLLLVIADDNTLYYYVDRTLVGTVENPPQDGEVGIAVVNFEPNSTLCQFTNFWLWEWEPVS